MPTSSGENRGGGGGGGVGPRRLNQKSLKKVFATNAEDGKQHVDSGSSRHHQGGESNRPALPSRGVSFSPKNPVVMVGKQKRKSVSSASSPTHRGGAGGGGGERAGDRRPSVTVQTMIAFRPGDDPYTLSLADQMRLNMTEMGITALCEQIISISNAWILWLLGSIFWDLTMFLITLYILTADTWRLLYVSKDNDWIVEIVNFFILTISIIDIVLHLLTEKKNYRKSFLFCMDVLSLSAISWDTALLGAFESGKFGVWYLNDQIYIAIGEAIRILCILRLAHLARLVNLDLLSLGCGSCPRRRKIKSGSPHQPFQDDETARLASARTGRTASPRTGRAGSPRSGRVISARLPGGGLSSKQSDVADHERSMVGMEFVEITIRKVITVIVLICAFFPLLEPSRFIYACPIYNFQKMGLEQLHCLAGTFYPYENSVPTAAEQDLLKQNVQDYVTIPINTDLGVVQGWSQVLSLELQHVPLSLTNQWLAEVNVTMWTSADLETMYRPAETPAYRIPGDNDQGQSLAYFLGKQRLDESSARNMELRLAVLLMVFLVGVFLTGTQSIVIAPIERMIKMVTSLKENPLAKLDNKRNASSAPTTQAGTRSSSGHLDKKASKTKGKSKKGSLISSSSGSSAGGGEMSQSETDLLETVLVKISELLQIGFGAAGAELISKNMVPGSTDVSAILSLGKKKTCIFGFTKMEDFSVMCSSLEEDVCTYINTIAKIVHGNVVNWNGAPNKNIGSAFFCVWKMGDDKSRSTLKTADVLPPRSSGHGPPATANVGGFPSIPQPTSTMNPLLHDSLPSKKGPSGGSQSNTTTTMSAMHVDSTDPSGSPTSLAPSAPATLPLTATSPPASTLYLRSPSSDIPPTPTPASPRGAHGTHGSIDSNINHTLNNHNHPIPAEPVVNLADCALVSVLKTRIELHCMQKHRDLLRFTRNPGIIERLGYNYEVKLNFGLHIGWAIEGALGSEYKIDATYLSPNVNLASRLEAATHQFDCPLLMSGDFVECLSPPIKDLCRKVDIITAKGSEHPMEIWTFDITDWPPDTHSFHIKRRGTRRGAYIYQSDLFKAMKELQKTLPDPFVEAYTHGIQQYVEGHWRAARDLLKQALVHKWSDGPTACLLRVIEGARCHAPPDWQGYRKLHEK